MASPVQDGRDVHFRLTIRGESSNSIDKPKMNSALDSIGTCVPSTFTNDPSMSYIPFPRVNCPKSAKSLPVASSTTSHKFGCVKTASVFLAIDGPPLPPRTK